MDTSMLDDFVEMDALIGSLVELGQGDPAVALRVAALWTGADVRSLDVLDLPAAQLTDALDTLRHALAAAPDVPALLQLLGLLEWKRDETPSAIRALNRVRSQDAASDSLKLTAQLALRRILRERGDQRLAGGLLSELLHHDPASFRDLLSLGRELDSTEHQSLCLRYLDRALAMRPDHPQALSLSASSRMRSGQIDEGAIAKERFERLLAVEGSLRDYGRAAFWAPYLGMPLAFEHRCWERIRACVNAWLESSGVAPYRHRPRHHQRLRLGYLSPAFGDHPVGHVTRDIYAAHDRTRFEVYLYPMTARATDHSVYKHTILASGDQVRPLRGLSPQAMAAAIHADEIDILIDLHGHMGTRNILTCALRPAPMQVYWLGHGGGLGLPCYDWLVGDYVVTPEQDDGHYVESVLRLPHCFHPGSPHPIAEDAPTHATEGLAAETFVFCAFNNPAKICPEVFAIWMRLLRDRPHSQLWLTQGTNPDLPRNLRRHAQALGVDPARLVFARRLPDKGQHLARHQLADLFLDTFTYNASTTCLDALWGGLPVLTRPGRHFCSRIAASQLQSIGLAELICDTSESYYAAAMTLATDPHRLAGLKERVRAVRGQSPLFDISHFVQGFEDALLRGWTIPSCKV
jgi:predicted O-linked N-acetylglucosamine transferase (SPINDLY family)